MNLYLVVSEMLTAIVCEDASVNACHEEDYCIAELVVARSRSQATYLAWQTDEDSRSTDMRDKPRFRCEIKGHDIDGPARIATAEYDDNEEWWSFNNEREEGAA